MSLFQNDQSLILAIRGSVPERDAALGFIFGEKSLQHTVVRYAVANGGSKEDGKDLFQDTVVLFDRAIREGKFNQKSSLNTFFVAIAKWQWANMRRKKYNFYEDLPNTEYFGKAESPETTFLKDEQRNILQQAVDQLGARCSALLHLYKLSYSMEEIAQETGLSTPEMAKKEVHRCRERLRNYLTKQPEILKLLK